MKVICTNHEAHLEERIIRIPIGQEVTVIDLTKFGGFDYYRIAEYPHIKDGITKAWYWEGNFSTLDGPDEVELLDQRAEAEMARLDDEYASILGEECFVAYDPEAHARVWQMIEKAMDEME